MTDYYYYPYIARTGGGDGALDSLDGSLIKDGDVAVVANADGTYFYVLDADSGVAESDPGYIAPDSNAGDKRWVRVEPYAGTKINYVDRGDASGNDLTKVDFTCDGDWHPISLTSIVPDGTKAVVLSVALADDAVASYVAFRKQGNTDIYNVFYLATQVSGVGVYGHGIVALNATRQISYKAAAHLADAGGSVAVTICGWFI